MSAVTIYTTQFCPYCVRARSLLKSKNVNYTEIAVDYDREQRSTMEQRSGRTSVPQIFIGDFHVGGCDDLYAMEAAGELDTKLSG